MQDNGDEWMSQKRNVGGLCERQIRYARKTYGIILSEESLETLLVEVEAIVDSRLLTTDLLTDLNILIPLSPINLPTMKRKVMMSPSRVFSTPDISSRKNGRRVQHKSNKIWDQWRMKVLWHFRADKRGIHQCVTARLVILYY